ncbi:MAG TPA: ATP-binding protein [Candidatus Ornithospirochaeta avicola]|uniref:ATP-binding protein n=1 Tax=Candidatus Ornithospirochaeta avicola TaxID=2840896 RepID=A0A9D1PSM8_9SPIO|nr:ATP-binding protein [Candidatus Ornithospirochaeta avicola]
MERIRYTEMLRSRLREKRHFIQVLTGPRQVGKSTIIADVLSTLEIPYVSESADDITVSKDAWLKGIWDRARVLARQHGEVLVVVDEIQKIPNWSESVKKLWDEDKKTGANVKVILSGSSRLLLMNGLSESLQGRFELIPVPHWSYGEMKKVFGFSLEEFVYFGSYPGPADLIEDEKRWKAYIRDSIMEPSLTNDILMLTPIQKPALLRQLMELGSYYSGQIMPFEHMLGQLSDAGNTTTLAHYLDLLRQSGLLAGLQKYSGSEVRKRASSPKLQVFNNALISSRHPMDFTKAKEDNTFWGRLVESAVGTHIMNSVTGQDVSLGYWREKQDEVDFVLYNEYSTVAFEVKSGNISHGRGQDVFMKRYPDSKMFTISAKADTGSMTIPLEDFLLSNPLTYL